jgi:choline dehydrogenase-like flavoprotein
VFADARTLPADTTLETDICIIGGGAAGITLAREFGGGPTRVLLLESGALEFDSDTQALAEGPVTGLPYFPLASARLRMFGGTTNHWGGVCRPFDEADFERREWIPFSGWPIRKADLDPFYEPARVITQVPSGDWDVDHWADRDRFPLLPLAGDRIQTRLAQLVPRSSRSFGRAYEEEVRRAGNVTVYLHANATEIETDEAGATVARVQAATLSGNRFSVAARQFVLAAGGIENPRLLLVSNARRSNGLGNQNDLVGRFFLEHPRFLAGMIAPTHPHLVAGFYDQHPAGGGEIRGYLAPSDEVQRAEGLVDIQIRLGPVYIDSFERAIASADIDSAQALVDAARRGETADDFGRHLTNVVDDLMSWQAFAIPGAPVPVPYPEVVSRLLRSTPSEVESLLPDLLGDAAAVAYREVLGSAPLATLNVTPRIVQAPNPDSRVTLTADRDELGLRRAQLEWRLSPLDKHSVLRTMEIFGAEIGRAGLGRLKILVDEDDAGWPDDLEGGWHHMGTTRMSDDPRQGVVDRNCRVHGISNLFVAGSSVFPTAGSGTPTLTLVALALRLSEHLKGIME